MIPTIQNTGGVFEDEENLSKLQMIEAAMLRAKHYAISQYQGVADYCRKSWFGKTYSHR